MVKTRAQKLSQILENDDLSGLSFSQSKNKLLKVGYSEDEISIAVASAPFDGKRNKPRAVSDYEKLLAQHPDTAEGIARELLIIDTEKRQEKTRLDAMADHAWDSSLSPMSAKTMTNLGDSLGIPIVSLFFGAFLVGAVAYGLHVFNIISLNAVFTVVRVYAYGISAFVALIFILREVRLNRLKTSERVPRLIGLLKVALYIGLFVLITYIPGWLLSR